MSAENTNEPLFEQMSAYGHQKIVFCSDPDTGHEGPDNSYSRYHFCTSALGGNARNALYKTEADALNDVLRLSKSMTYKAVHCRA